MRPVVHPVAERAYALLPNRIRSLDAENDFAMLRYVAAAAHGFEPAADVIAGSGDLVDAQRTPRAWLAWLGWMLGIDVTALPVDQARSVVAGAGQGQRRGSRNAIKAAVARTLSNQSPPPRVWANFSGVTPYDITVITNTAQTPDPVATLLAALSEKPAGMVVELQVVEATTWAEVEMQFDTWADVEAAFATWADLEEWIPTT